MIKLYFYEMHKKIARTDTHTHRKINSNSFGFNRQKFLFLTLEEEKKTTAINAGIEFAVPFFLQEFRIENGTQLNDVTQCMNEHTG